MARGGISPGGQVNELWQQSCPECRTPAHGPEHPQVVCGSVEGRCACSKCGCDFELRPIEYWRWLGAPSPPPARDAASGPGGEQ